MTECRFEVHPIELNRRFGFLTIGDEKISGETNWAGSYFTDVFVH